MEGEAQGGQRKAQTRAQFDRIVDDYDTSGPGNFAYFGERLVAATGVAPGDRVLDVATGRGAVLFPAAARLRGSGEAVGIDLSPGMVQAAAAEAARRGLRLQVRVMDAEHLEFPDRSFDCLLCGFGIMFFPDLDGALSEFMRVLRPGGRLGVSTWRQSQAEDLSDVLRELNLAPPAPPGWVTEPDALARLLAAAGFTNVRVSEDVKAFRYANIEEYWQNARGTGLRGAIDSLDEIGRTRVAARLAGRLGSCQSPDGLEVPASALLATASR